MATQELKKKRKLVKSSINRINRMNIIFYLEPEAVEEVSFAGAVAVLLSSLLHIGAVITSRALTMFCRKVVIAAGVRFEIRASVLSWDFFAFFVCSIVERG